MSGPHDEYKELHEKSFLQGQDGVARQMAKQQFKDQLADAQEALELAEETLDVADRMEKSGDPHKKALARAFKNAIVKSAGLVAAGEAPTGGGGIAAEASPFIEGSSTSLPPSETKSLNSTPPTKALLDQTTSQSPKKRGRPPGSKNRKES